MSDKPHFGHTRTGLPVHLRTRDHLALGHPNPVIRFNARLALIVTLVVGSMWCAYGFAALAIAGLPTALKPGNIGLLYWISGDLLQLTLLSVIIVGQNIQANAADARAAKTFEDGEANKAALEITLDRLSLETEGGLKDLYDRLRAEITAAKP